MTSTLPLADEKIVSAQPFLLSTTMPVKSAGALAGVNEVIEAMEAGCAPDDGSYTATNGFVKASPYCLATIVGKGSSAISFGISPRSIAVDLGDLTVNSS